MIAVGLSDRGLLRDNNQDYFFVSENKEMPLFILADGMGGYKGGEIASMSSVKIVKEIFEKNYISIKEDQHVINLIDKSFYEANRYIYNKAKNSEELSGMGTTLILLYIFNNKLFIGHVGDSRVYIVKKELIQITEDHSLVNELVKNGEITVEEARTHPKKNLITRAVGVNLDVKADIYIKENMTCGKILLCSDGLSNMITDEEIYKLINSSKKEGKEGLCDICNNLVEKAKENGGKDNITAILIEL